jgi:hypothetical protein
MSWPTAGGSCVPLKATSSRREITT